MLDALGTPHLDPEDRHRATHEFNRTLAMLREFLHRDASELAARLVAAHGPELRVRLHGLRDLPQVAALFTPRPDAPPVTTHTAAVLARRRRVRAAQIALVRRYGLGVFDVLNAHASDPDVRALLDLAPRRARGRPAGRTGHDLEAYAIATVTDDLGIPRIALLWALGRNPAHTVGDWPDLSETGDAKWYRRRLQRGRQLRQHAASPIATSSPDEAVIAFLDSYARGLPPKDRLALLSRYLVNAIPEPRLVRLTRAALGSNGRSEEMWLDDVVRTRLAAHLQTRLERYLPPPHA